MTAHETLTLANDKLLYVCLWVEVLVYFFFGSIMFFKWDFKARPSYMKNNAELYFHCNGEKMHSCLCLILGFTALLGLIGGELSRVEMEISFICLGMIMGMLWNFPPNMTLVLVVKPETWLNSIYWLFYWDTVRWPVLAFAAFF